MKAVKKLELEIEETEKSTLSSVMELLGSVVESSESSEAVVHVTLEEKEIKLPTKELERSMKVLKALAEGSNLYITE